MAIDETGLTKGQVRKLNALRKSVGDDLACPRAGKWSDSMRPATMIFRGGTTPSN